MRAMAGLFFLATASLAHAQFFDFLADWSDKPPSDSRAFVADITATLKARSPWGEITTVESGKYWRSAQGQDRFDNAYGFSEMRDRHGPVVHIRIDRKLRLVDIEEKTASPAAMDPWIILPFSFTKGPQKSVEGLAATVRTGQDHDQLRSLDLGSAWLGALRTIQDRPNRLRAAHQQYPLHRARS